MGVSPLCPLLCDPQTMGGSPLFPPPFGVSVTPNHWALLEDPPQFSALRSALPPNVHLLTLAMNGDAETALLLRVEHQFESGESGNGSRPVSIDLQVGGAVRLTALRETPLWGTDSAMGQRCPSQTLIWGRDPH